MFVLKFLNISAKASDKVKVYKTTGAMFMVDLYTIQNFQTCPRNRHHQDFYMCFQEFVEMCFMPFREFLDIFILNEKFLSSLISCTILIISWCWFDKETGEDEFWIVFRLYVLYNTQWYILQSNIIEEEMTEEDQDDC